MRRRGASAAALALAAAALPAIFAPACADGRPRPSILVVTIDTLRADAVSSWGREAGTTPRLDGLAARGLRFSAASTVTPLTLPAHASLFSGLRPARHGLTVNGLALPSLPTPLLAERLAAEGYATAAFVSSAVLDARHGLDAGFATYDDALRAPDGPPLPVERRGDHTVDRALAWTGWSGERFLGWVHLFDPHAPYAAPGGPEGEDRAAYLAEVRFADEQLGRLLDGVAERARGPVLVVVTSDHGEGLGEHGEETHGLLLAESTLHVPLVIAWLGAPGTLADARAEAALAAPGVREDPVSLLDVTPSLLAALGLPAVEGADGAPAWAPAPGRALPLETRVPWFYYGFSPLVGVRRDAEKLVGAEASVDPAWTLHELGQDPAELSGRVVGQHPLLAFVRSAEPVREAEDVADPGALAVLGYFGGAAREPARRPPPDPRDRMDLIRALDSAQSAIVREEPQRALSLLDALPADDQDVPELLLLRGRALSALGRHEEALLALERATELRPTAALLTERGLVELRLAEAGRGPVGGAAATLDAALRLAPRDPRAIFLRASADLMQARPELARRRAEAGLAERPEHVDLLTVRWRALKAQGLSEQAADAAAQLRRLWPEHPDLR